GQGPHHLAALGREQERGRGGAASVEHETLAAPARGREDGGGVRLGQRERRAQCKVEQLRPRPALGRVPQAEQHFDRFVLPRLLDRAAGGRGSAANPIPSTMWAATACHGPMKSASAPPDDSSADSSPGMSTFPTRALKEGAENADSFAEE